MGFNFQAGHPAAVFDDAYAQACVALLRERFGDAVPLGPAEEPSFCLEGELSWGAWKQLQTRALQELGADASVQLRGVDAWKGVYLDTDVEREVVWPEGQRRVSSQEAALAVPEMHARGSVEPPKVSFGVKFLRFFGVPIGPPAPIDPSRFIGVMVENFGARAGEEAALQVGNLRVLRTELDAMVRRAGATPSQEDVRGLLASAASGSDTQCLCHAWLTARHALEHRTPMWLIK